MLVSGLAVWRLVSTENEPDKVRRFAIVEPLAQSSVNERPLALFRDGSKLVYTTRDSEARSVLSPRPLDRFEATTIPGTAGGLQPFIAPDGNWLGFYANGDLKKSRVRGGRVFTRNTGRPVPGPSIRLVSTQQSSAAEPQRSRRPASRGDQLLVRRLRGTTLICLGSRMRM